MFPNPNKDPSFRKQSRLGNKLKKSFFFVFHPDGWKSLRRWKPPQLWSVWFPSGMSLYLIEKPMFTCVTRCDAVCSATQDIIDYEGFTQIVSLVFVSSLCPVSTCRCPPSTNQLQKQTFGLDRVLTSTPVQHLGDDLDRRLWVRPGPWLCWTLKTDSSITYRCNVQFVRAADRRAFLSFYQLRTSCLSVFFTSLSLSTCLSLPLIGLSTLLSPWLPVCLYRFFNPPVCLPAHLSTGRTSFLTNKIKIPPQSK